ncbi:glycine N-acyltransferase isoform X1 [Mugil cephalus]|uniref:glycine N-acyltransferase isoform X1 n=1 Tax=Mugil cephalus TaxID=48193 RepID=UPI001FB58EF7|nr:glycine N-acyltransferase isoform X1 [Mugil cephalus]
MELTEDQQKTAEIEVKRYLPRSQQVYGYLMLKNRVRSDPVKILVDRWPQFNVIVCKPQWEERGDHFKDMIIFAKDGAALEEIIRKSSVIDWTQNNCFGTSLPHMEIIKALAAEKNVPIEKLAVCHMMILEDIHHLPSIERYKAHSDVLIINNSFRRHSQTFSLFRISSGISLSSLDESHVALVNQMWKFGKDEEAVRMIRNMVTNFPSCCVLGADGQPVSWMLTYASCAMGMLYTLPEHRGKGYAKVLISCMAKRHHAQGYPVYCFVEEENVVSYRLLKNMGFTEDPSYRETWCRINQP